MTSFKELGLSAQVLKAIEELGFEKPSEIQEQAIPILMEGLQDFIGLAQTGTGKTAAFGIPLLERIDPHSRATQALILAPTRELGQQIAEQLALFSKHLDKVNVLAVYGGANITNQIKALGRPQHVIIATPGRLIDLIKRKKVKLEELQFLVLDEADEMLNMGFKDELDKILSYTPTDKLTWLFSATMPNEIKKIVKKYMTDPAEVRVNTKNEVNKNIKHQFLTVSRANKTECLTRFLDADPTMHTLVFCRTKRETQALAEDLQKSSYKADAIHGDLSQSQRDRVMKRFKSHDLKVLIATDVAARGIDVNDLTHVFHFTLPDDDSYYTHRSGRTARAGKEGISISFINGRENGKIRRLEKQLNISFEKIDVPKATEIAALRIESWCEEILNTKVKNKENQELLEVVNLLFADLSKEELITKIASYELGKLNLNNKDFKSDDRSERSDRNRRDDRRGNKNDKWSKSKKGGDSKWDKNKGEKRERKGSGKGKGNQSRYFINLGSRDKISKHDLIDFICDITEIKRTNIGDIDLQKSHSYFEVESDSAKKIASKFKGIVLEDGRELRVNKDH